jgi:hypothetical protein
VLSQANQLPQLALNLLQYGRRRRASANAPGVEKRAYSRPFSFQTSDSYPFRRVTPVARVVRGPGRGRALPDSARSRPCARVYGPGA